MTFRRYLLDVLAGDRYLITDMENSHDVFQLSQVIPVDEDPENLERTIIMYFGEEYYRTNTLKVFNSKVDPINKLLNKTGCEIITTGRDVKPCERNFTTYYKHYLNLRVRGSIQEINQLAKRLKTHCKNISLENA